jgi:hypothetical protein
MATATTDMDRLVFRLEANIGGFTEALHRADRAIRRGRPLTRSRVRRILRGLDLAKVTDDAGD